MAAHGRRLKTLMLTLGDESTDNVQAECQLRSWNLANNSAEGEKLFTYCTDPDGQEFREETDPDYALEATFLADWREDGISTWLWQHDGELVNFVLDHHPDIAAEHCQWSGQLYVRAPNVGGEVRTTEETTVTLPIEGKPDFLGPDSV